MWEDTRNPYDNGLRHNWAELCCGWVGGVPPEKSAALASDEEAMLPSQPADQGRAGAVGMVGATMASRLEQGAVGLVAGHSGQEMLPMAAPQPLPLAEEGRAVLPSGGGGGDGGDDDVSVEASEDWANLELERRAMIESRGAATLGDSGS